MRQSGVDTLITEEPDDRIGQVRICGRDGQQWPSLPGIPPILPSRTSGYLRKFGLQEGMT
jgi:hypothetical protein